MERGIVASWPAFPPELLHTLQESAGDGARLRFVLVDGSQLTASRIAAETELGIVIETQDGARTGVPWHTILRVDALRGDEGRSVGFRTA
jgi:hypothetical protein